MKPTALTVDALAVSPFNVRTNAEDATSVDALEDSIAACGLLEPLVVHRLAGLKASEVRASDPERPKGAAWGVLAGGRRLRAIRNLIEVGRLPAEWPVPVTALDLDPATDAAAIIELSAAENILRRELRPYEIHAAIARAADEGASLAEIAATLGQRDQVIARHLRLGRLDPEIFAALAAGRISHEQAQAYAATEDHALQRATWTHFGGASGHVHLSAASLRAHMKVGDYELARLLRFVGLEAYRQAGGTFELDLFFDGPEDRGRVVDEGVLRELAEKRLEQARGVLRAFARDSDLRFVAKRPDEDLAIVGPVTMGEFYKPANTTGRFPEGSVCFLEITAAGELLHSFWWESRKAKAAAAKGDAPQHEPATTNPATVRDDGGFDTIGNYAAAQAARAAVRDEHGLTADGLHVMRSLRREILRALLVDDSTLGGTLGRDYLVWSQLRQELGRDRAPAIGARGLAGVRFGSDDLEPRDFVAPFLDETHAHAIWSAAVESIAGRAWLAEDVAPADAFTLYVGASELEKSQAAAILAGLALLRSANVPGWRIPPHDVLAQRANGDDAMIRELWSPTPMFMGLLPKLKRLEHAEPFVDPTAFKSWVKKDDKTIAGATAAALDPATHSDPSIAAGAAKWVHPLLRFTAHPEEPHTGVSKGPEDSDDERELEPAIERELDPAS